MKNQKDMQEVGLVLRKLGKSFAASDTRGLEDIYAQDVDWINAFGTALHGKDNVIAYLKKLFADPHFSTGRLIGEPEGSIRLVLEGKIAIARTFAKRQGQQSSDGQSLPVRRNHSLKVLEKKEGKWLIISEMYMDARDEKTLT